MSEYYVLQDLSSWDINKGYFKEEGTTLSELVDYVDHNVRQDMVSIANSKVDVAVEAMQRENFPLAQQYLRNIGIHLHLECK